MSWLGDGVRWSDVRERPAWGWAFVTSTAPLGLRMDGDVVPIGVPPTVLAHVGPLAVDDKVWCQINPGGAVIVQGKAV